MFLLPGCLQFDLSFTPASKFGASGPKFRLLYGKAVEKPHLAPPDGRELFGYAVLFAVRARFCIERERYWQAEYWISNTRDYALKLACLRRQLPTVEGKGFDRLPAEIRDRFRGALVANLTREELLRALHRVIDGLLHETGDVEELAVKVEPQLLELTAEWNT